MSKCKTSDTSSNIHSVTNKAATNNLLELNFKCWGSKSWNTDEETQDFI